MAFVIDIHVDLFSKKVVKRISLILPWPFVGTLHFYELVFKMVEEMTVAHSWLLSLIRLLHTKNLRYLPWSISIHTSELPFTKRTDVLPHDLGKHWNCRIWILTFSITLKFDRHLGSTAAEMHVKFQSNMMIITSNLTALRLYEVWP